MPRAKKTKFDFESPETNPKDALPEQACVLVTKINGKEYDVKIEPTADGIMVEIIDYHGLNTLATAQAYDEDIGKLGMEG